ncbi:MAG: hypothetical protein Unbinned4944contig1000_28 [Prokaryotic dsDNA virus sp.]|nr:MAG: hypothetical protein Unbinned4944contig1000_28 [Prokaryotic dsDNA virus sp.]
MVLLLSLIGFALGSELPRWPEASATVSGECASTLGLTKGSLINPLLIDDGGLARCSGVVEPLSSYAHLLAIESHAKQVRSIYELETSRLVRERDYWQREANRATEWYREPWFVAVTTSALVTGVIVTYSWSTGGTR